jgi:two-component system nitrogen regulation sensor histidine kinase GlnL
MATAVLTFDEQLHLTSVNPAGEALFGISAKKILGQSLADLLPHSPRLARSLNEALASRHPFTARGVVLRTVWGRTVTVDCTVTPISPEGGDGALLVELTQVDRLLRLAREEERLDRQTANRAVMRGLAHEIKNPLGGLRGAAQLLERELPSDTLREYTRVIIHEADRLRNLVDRLTGPIQPLQMTPVNIHDVLEHVRRLIEAEYPELVITRHYDPSLPERPADREQLIQAVLNVVRNAAQAVGGRGTIVLATRIERGLTLAGKRHRLALRIDVEDNGPGIPPSLQEHIFYPMVTGRPEGTGLGLAITQDILHRHGGLIEFASRPGKTVFTLYLPVEDGHDQG